MSKFLVQDVVDGGFCTGCGACAAVCRDISIKLTADGAMRADLSKASAGSLDTASRICPFSDLSPNETEVGARLFGAELPRDNRVGHYLSLGAGNTADDDARYRSGSGGLTNWVLEQLLSKGMIQGVIHVGQDDRTPCDGKALFAYRLSYTIDELYSGSKSKYYSTEMSAALNQLRGDGKRYAIVGVPCFITAARHIAEVDAGLSEQLAYFVGLVCGHLKSTRFAELMAWQNEVTPADLETVDFRKKVPNLPANKYHFAAKSKSTGEWHSEVASSLYGGDWGHAFFQLKGCDYCDDIFAEAADVVFGDAWIARYEADWLGTNVFITRRDEFEDILAEGKAGGRITFDTLGLDEIAGSQGGNYRHRWDGLSLRLAMAKQRGEALPTKRIAPGSRPLGFFRRRIVRLRQEAGQRSHAAFAKALERQDLAVFFREMKPLTEKMRQTYWAMHWLSPRRLAGSMLRRMRRALARSQK